MLFSNTFCNLCLSLHLHKWMLHRTKDFNFDEVQLVKFSSIDFIFCVKSMNSLLSLESWGFSLILFYFFWNCYCVGFKLQSVIHLEINLHKVWDSAETLFLFFSFWCPVAFFEKIGFPGGAVIKNLPASAGDARDVDLILGSGRFPGVGNGNPLQYSCLENSRYWRVWQATVHGLSQNQIYWAHTHLPYIGSLFHLCQKPFRSIYEVYFWVLDSVQLVYASDLLLIAICVYYCRLITGTDPRCLSGKESAWQVGDVRLMPGLGRLPWRRKCNPLQYSCLGNPMERGSWWVTVCEIAKESEKTSWLSNNNKILGRGNFLTLFFFF